jgi:hypothetical protein
MLDFNPNTKPRLNTWATYVPGRSTKAAFSTHRLPSHAKSALGSSVGIIYEHVDGEWTERFRRDAPDDARCAGCGAPHRYRRVPGSWRQEEVPGGAYLHGSWAKGDGFVYEWWCGACRTSRHARAASDPSC